MRSQILRYKCPLEILFFTFTYDIILHIEIVDTVCVSFTLHT